MREKMRAHLGSAEGESRFDLKHDRGGIVDIEFMVQYLILILSGCTPRTALQIYPHSALQLMLAR
jgi:Glutamine synthetase adenylyltransferase